MLTYTDALAEKGRNRPDAPKAALASTELAPAELEKLDLYHRLEVELLRREVDAKPGVGAKASGK